MLGPSLCMKKIESTPWGLGLTCGLIMLHFTPIFSPLCVGGDK